MATTRSLKDLVQASKDDKQFAELRCKKDETAVKSTA